MSQIHISTLTLLPLLHVYFCKTYRVDSGCPYTNLLQTSLLCSYTVDVNPFGKHLSVFWKPEHIPLLQLRNPLLDIFPIEESVYVQQKTRIRIFIAVLVIIAINREQPKSMSMEGINKIVLPSSHEILCSIEKEIHATWLHLRQDVEQK